jgi:hypothetical protein
MLLTERGPTRASETISPDEAMLQCIRECIHCHSVCRQTVRHCLNRGGEIAEPSRIRLLLDCARICETAANLMTRASERGLRACAACAEICERCTAECERFGGDALMRGCAEACRACAAACWAVVGTRAEPIRA